MMPVSQQICGETVFQSMWEISLHASAKYISQNSDIKCKHYNNDHEAYVTFTKGKL